MSAAVEVVVGADDVDLASGLLWAAGVSAVAEHPEGGGRVRLRADVPSGGVEEVRSALGGRWPVSEVQVDDGLSAWREHAVVTRVGRRLVVRPPWVPLGDVDPDDLVLEIDPGSTFGHGAHPTTRLCLAALEAELDARPGATVLDVGCGSGVLAVAAARLGAARVVAVDVDPAAVEATRANAAANGVADRVEATSVSPPGGGSAIEQPRTAMATSGGRAAGRAGATPATASGGGAIGPAPPVGPLASLPGPFDVVVANIGAAALVALATDLVGHVAPGGVAVLSGLLDPPPPEVGAAHVPLVVAGERGLDGWSALVLRTP